MTLIIIGISLTLGTVIGAFLMILCVAASGRDSIYHDMTLIPISVAEPRLDSQCLVQTKEDGNHLLIAEYADDGWALIDLPAIKHFTVVAWCYLPEPIRI